MREKLHEMHCLRCESTFLARRSDARYCSNRCREAAYRLRHVPPGVGGPLTLDDLRPPTMAELAEFFAWPAPPDRR